MPIKITYEIVKKQIEKEGYKLLSTEYINAHSKLEIQCSIGHKYKANWNKFKTGRRCPECKKDKISISRTLNYNDIKKQIEKEGYKLLSTEYINAHSHLLVKCDKDHEYNITWNNFNNGYRCPICSIYKKSEKSRFNIDYIKKQIEKEGYKLLSTEYINARSKLKIVCNSGHIYEATYGDFKSGNRCPNCNPMYSKSEKEIAEYIRKVGIEIIENCRKRIINPLTGRPLELDIFIPELNKAIEFNGRYWHKREDAKKRDRIKKQQCKKKGIDLLVIKEQDWIDNRDLCLCDINEFLLS